MNVYHHELPEFAHQVILSNNMSLYAGLAVMMKYLVKDLRNLERIIVVKSGGAN